MPLDPQLRASSLAATKNKLKDLPRVAELLTEYGYQVDPADKALEFLTLGGVPETLRASRDVGFQSVLPQKTAVDWTHWERDEDFLGARTVPAAGSVEHGRHARQVATEWGAQCYLAPQGLYRQNASARSHIFAAETFRLMVDIDAPGVFETLFPEWIAADLVPHILLVTGVRPDIRVQAFFQLDHGEDAEMPSIRRAQQQLCGIDANAYVFEDRIASGGDAHATSGRQLGRVPFSENYASKSKLDAGYSPRFTVIPLIRKDAPRTYSLDEIAQKSTALYPSGVTFEMLHLKTRDASPKVDRSEWATPSEPAPYYYLDHKQRLLSGIEGAAYDEYYNFTQRGVFQVGSLCCYGYDTPEDLEQECRLAAASFLADEPTKAEEVITSTFAVGQERRCDKVDDHVEAEIEIAEAVRAFSSERPQDGLSAKVRSAVNDDIARIDRLPEAEQGNAIFGVVAKWVRATREGTLPQRFVYLASFALVDHIGLAKHYDARGWRRGPGGARKLLSDATDRGLGLIDWGTAP